MKLPTPQPENNQTKKNPRPTKLDNAVSLSEFPAIVRSKQRNSLLFIGEASRLAQQQYDLSLLRRTKKQLRDTPNSWSGPTPQLRLFLLFLPLSRLPDTLGRTF